MNIITGMENEALSFMEKRKKIEDKRKKEMLKNNEEMFKEIIALLVLTGNISISFLPYFIQNEIKPIVNKYRIEQQNFVDSFIRDDFKIGIETGQKLLSLSGESIDPYNPDFKDSDYEKVLTSLLLYAERVVNSQHDDLISNLNKDITTIYITGKNIQDKDAQKNTDNEKNSTLNTVLSGALISKYINPTFKNINNRTNMTAQNETNRAINHGVLMRYLIAKRDNLSGLKVKWVEVQDDRLCQYCRAAGQGGDYGNGVYDIGDVTPPPLHSRCRCILIPFLSKWGEVDV
jgi:hypothetical protein